MDEASNIEENFIALLPDRPVDVVNDEMRSNEISINPIATLVLQSEYPAQETRERDYTGNVSKSSKTPKSLTSQEVEGKLLAFIHHSLTQVSIPRT